jgi:hypothetical protein
MVGLDSVVGIPIGAVPAAGSSSSSTTGYVGARSVTISTATTLVVLHPAVDRDVADLDTPFGEQLLDVTVGQPEAQVPADRQNDHVGWEAEADEGGP